MTKYEYEYEVIAVGIEDTSVAPKAKDIFYRCSICGGMVPSLTKDNVGCSCGNIFIDIDAWKFFVRDYSKIEILKQRKKLRGPSN